MHPQPRCTVCVVLRALGYLLSSLAEWVTGYHRVDRRDGQRGEHPTPIADEVEGWLWVRDELGHGGLRGTSANRDEPPDKR